MRKTKIICTLGPATEDDNVLRDLMLSGMNVARINFSHGTHESHLKTINRVKKMRSELGLPVALLLDTSGPEIRVGDFEDGKIELKKGDTFVLTTKDVMGTKDIVSITYKELVHDVKPGMRILIDDGLIEMKVKEVTDTDIVCCVENGGAVSNHKGVNVPNANLSMPYISEKDRGDILFGIEQDFDFIAASFVRSADDVAQIRKILDEKNCDSLKIISKIENRQGVDNIDEILDISDGIMVARGDMGVEIPIRELPAIQKMIIKKVYNADKVVITATQMLDSMIRNPRPTRAEVTDVANAIYDGTDVVMLSGETANGKYPLEALKMMVKIAERTERDIKDRATDISKVHSKRSVSSAVCNATVQTADNLNAKAIVCPTISGFTARLTSKLKPNAEIIGCSPYDNVLRKMQIYWGVRPLKTATETSTDKIIEHALVVSEQAGFVEEGDIVIVSAGIATTSDPSAKRGLTNTMRVVTI